MRSLIQFSLSSISIPAKHSWYYFQTHIYYPAPPPTTIDMIPTRFQGMNDVQQLALIYKIFKSICNGMRK
jgi:hypothetical protein